MKRFPFFVVMAALTVPALLAGCIIGDDEAGSTPRDGGSGGSAASVIDVSRSDIPSGPGWSYREGVFTIANGANVILIKDAEENRIVVASGATATVMLFNVSIDLDGNVKESVENAPAFDASGANVTLVLGKNSTNTLKSNGHAAGVQAPAGSKLAITSEAGTGSASGTLKAYGGQEDSACMVFFGERGGWIRGGGNRYRRRN
jgi:hypothetical protein